MFSIKGELDIKKIPELSFGFEGQTKALDTLKTYIQNSVQQRAIAKQRQIKFLLCCSSTQAVIGIKNILFEAGIASSELKSFSEVQTLEPSVIGIAPLKIDEAFEAGNIVFVPDIFIIGKRLEDVKRSIKKDLSRMLKQASSFNEGSLVVHREYGVAVFEGLTIVSVLNKEYEMIKLRYKGREELFIPIDRVGLLSKYHEQNIAPEDIDGYLDSFTNRSFAKKKLKTKEEVRIIAEKIILAAANRSLASGNVFSKNSKVSEFYGAFSYAPTEDQENAIKDIEEDLLKGSPMDRLICGDVGFGKTEVAMRGAYLITSGKDNGEYYGQVCVIVPTTILARQHYKNFTKRFKNTNVKIAELSRSITPQQKKAVLAGVKSGEIDILIGTHGVFANSTEFKNLELVIIDEEQHFGVKQKEKLKQNRHGVHFLYLSATPIPRTLHMSLSGLKDISLITTPPVDRVNVQTFVMDYDDLTLRNAMLREKERGGRTFFVCPRVMDTTSREEYLAKIVPELKVAVAHGKMAGEELDTIMLDFYEGKYDVLLTTTIIESGIDISFANTMIIHRADMFGLSALYQLRGRVGRSGTQAYCYLLTNIKQLAKNKEASLRLKTISSIASLGAGFSVASSDMDIRGFGSLVGEEQSGSVKSLGAELYQDLVREAVEKLKNQATDQEEADFVPEVKLGLSVLIPKEYITDYNLRMEFYKKLAMCLSEDELLIISSEMQDRFGKLPQEIVNLISLIKIRELCKKYFIERLDCGDNGLVFSVHKIAPKEVIAKIMQAMSKNPAFSMKSNSQVMYAVPNAEDTRDIFVTKTLKKIFET